MSGIEVFQDPLQVLPSDFNNLIGIESEQEHTEANIGDEFYGQVGGNDGNVGAAVGQHNPAVLVEPVSEYPPYEIFQGQDEVHEVNFQVQQPDNGGHQEVDQALSANEVERPASVTNPFSETFLEDFPPKFIKGAFVESDQIDVKRDEISVIQVASEPFTGKYAIALVHDKEEYLSDPIVAKDDAKVKESKIAEALVDSNDKPAFMAWTDKAGMKAKRENKNEVLDKNTDYSKMGFGKHGTQWSAILDMDNENLINIKPNTESSHKCNRGQKMKGRLWSIVGLKLVEHNNAIKFKENMTPLQVMAELRDPKKLKGKKRKRNMTDSSSTSTSSLASAEDKEIIELLPLVSIPTKRRIIDFMKAEQA